MAVSRNANRWYVITIAAWCVLCPVSTAFGQVAATDVTVTPRPVGSGARAVGQSAFIGVADDATAASWNPAGLIQLERPEASLVGTWFGGLKGFDSSSILDFDIGRQSRCQPDINYLSYVQPFEIGGRDLVMSVNYHHQYDFGLNLDFTRTMRGPRSRVPVDTEVTSRGGLAATSLAGAYALLPELTVGAAFNLHHSGMYENRAWKVTTKGRGNGVILGNPVTFSYRNEEDFDNFRAWNMTFGVMWDVWAEEGRLLTLGGVFHTPYTADVRRTLYGVSHLNGAQFNQYLKEDLEMNFPASAGIGANYRFSDAWSVSGDVQWTDWSEYEQKDGRGVRHSPLGGGLPGRLDDTVSVRLGTEYLFFTEQGIFPLRAGVFYEPRPALDRPMDVYGFSVGTGWSTDRFSVDCCYQFRYGDDVSGENLGLPVEADYDTTEHLVMVSFIYYF